MRALSPTTKYRKDLKRQKKRGKDLAKLDAALRDLQQNGELRASYGPHKLSGEWNDLWECHIEPDWLLIYDVNDAEVQLIRTGTLSDLFG